ncbi:MAG: hypothetical protein ACI96W_000877 [Paraglaciecola sp.]
MKTHKQRRKFIFLTFFFFLFSPFSLSAQASESSASALKPRIIVIPLGGTSTTMAPTINDTKIGCASWIISYMPYGTNASQIIYATRFPNGWFNTSASSGNVVVTAIDDQGNSYDLGVIANLGVGITKLAPKIEEALISKGFTANKFSFTMTVDNPENVMFYASYNVGGSDRGFVEILCR